MVLAIMAAGVFNTAFAQDPGGNADAMKAWQEAATPGKFHKMLDVNVGKWDAEMKMWMGPGEPVKSTGTEECRWVMGGRYLEQNFKGTAMGMPMEGKGFTGYDNFNKKYVGFWIDNFGTGMATMDGQMDPDGKTLTLNGTMDEPATGQHAKPVRYIARVLDQNTRVFEMHDLTLPEPNTKVMEITYKRKK